LRQRKVAGRAGKLLIVDASSLFRRGQAQNFLKPEHAAQILKWVDGFRDVPDRVSVIGLPEIEKESWTLNISRYVVPRLGEDISPLPEAVVAFKQSLARCRDAEDHLRHVMEEGGWLS
jgi:type I restriction enzyme M protein